MKNTTAQSNSDLNKRLEDAMCVNETQLQHPWWHALKYLVVGMAFGMLFIKAEIISWFRIQEMFRFQSFHMYGVIGSAVITGMISVILIKKFDIKTIYGEKIIFHNKEFNKGNLYAQIGTGATVIVITLLSAIAGTWFYGLFKEKLPH
jgi:hypothetical protein